MGDTPTASASTPNILNMSTVHVKGISSQTSEKEIRDFFSFCGKIQSLSVTPESSDANGTQSASVTFEKETAAKTALLLDNTQLGPAQVSVSSAKSLDEAAGGKTAGSYDEKGEDGEIPQEDKSRSRIVAEYLAHGYALSDNAVQRAIQMDQQHGVSNRFMKALTDFDSKYKASEKTKAMDEKYGVSARAGPAGVASLPTLSARRTRPLASAFAHSTTRVRSKPWTFTTKPVTLPISRAESLPTKWACTKKATGPSATVEVPPALAHALQALAAVPTARRTRMRRRQVSRPSKRRWRK